MSSQIKKVILFIKKPLNIYRITMGQKIEFEKELYVGEIIGYAHVKNSEGVSDNLSFYAIVLVNTDDNTCKVKYKISVFRGKEDEYVREFKNYNKALLRYNYLAEKFEVDNEED